MKNKKKVGIITYHRSYNYGTVLQAYATAKTVYNLGYQAEIIDFENKYDKNVYKTFYWNNKKNVKSNVKNIVKNVLFRLEHYGKKNFGQFINSLPLTTKKYDVIIKDEVTESFDIFLLGSDQVWNANITGGELEPAFLLDIPINRPKISYASSFGGYKLKEAETKIFVRALEKFNYIGVREEFAKKSLISYCDRINSTVVLDPTFLLDRDQWRKIYSVNKIKKKLPQKYILVYLMVKYEEYKELIEVAKKKLGLPVVLICHYTVLPTYKKEVDYYLKDVSPENFMELIDNASFVITSSYHGTAFSVNFNKPFVSLYKEKSSIRAIDLLNLLKVENRIIKEAKDFTSDLINIDYVETNKILNNLRVESTQWLSDSLQSAIGEQNE